VLVFLVLLLAFCQADFIPDRLRIVDSNDQLNTFLVRGNLPIKNKKFQI